MARDETKTVKLSVEEIIDPSWTIIAAMLERLSPGGGYVLRLGLIETAHRILEAMTKPNAKADLVNELRFTVEALAHMPWD